MNSDYFDSDIAIVGAGPAGSCAAWEAKRNELGLSVSIFEEHRQIGLPRHCSGLYATDGLQNLGVNLAEIKKKYGFNEIRRSKFIAPCNNSFEIDRKKNSLVVLDRVALDHYLMDRAKKLGCNFHFEHRVKFIHFNNNGWNLRINHKKTKKDKSSQHKILISAEGAHARLNSSIGLPIPNKNWLFPGLQYEFDQVQDIQTDCVELFFGRNYAPGFFGWFIPIDGSSARLGIAVERWFTGKIRHLMNRFMKKHPLLCDRLKRSKITKSYGGFVPGTGPINRTYFSNFMTIGDAAGQSKATTGGGVNIGGYCGRIAGFMAKDIVSNKVSPDDGCRNYQKQWKAHFEPDLTLMKIFRRIITPFSDKTWNEIIQIARNTEINESFRRSNIDLHGKGLLKYALTPRVFIRSFRLIPQLTIGLLKGLSV
ncbi:MAG: geranylgeranyl reductase family protein [Candidatus Hodarchaeales archaeon]|jgi:geranylgeranyl reductase family protein